MIEGDYWITVIVDMDLCDYMIVDGDLWDYVIAVIRANWLVVPFWKLGYFSSCLLPGYKRCFVKTRKGA